MMDPRVSKMAEVMVNYSASVKKGDFVVIQSGMAAKPLVKEIYKYCLLAGAHPYVAWISKDLQEIDLKYSNEEQLTYVPSIVLEMIKTADVFMQIVGDTNTRALTNADPNKMRMRTAGMKAINEIYVKRRAADELKASITVFPTEATAQEASMSLTEYEDFVFGACGLDDDEPVQKWLQVKTEQDKICDFLNTKKQLRIVSTDTDISMSVEGRKWVNCCGHVNFPDGEVFTGPIEDSVEGTIRFSFPGIFRGKEVEDIRLRFEKGKVVEFSAAKGEEFLKQMLETDEGAKLVGEIGIGTNHDIKKFTKHMLFDEKIGSTIHIALGMGIPESGSSNMSSIHWDMLCDMRNNGEIYADGELIYKNGQFLMK